MSIATAPSIDIDRSWEARAACATVDEATARRFFSDELTDIASALHICAACPVRTECLETALARKEQWGVWGGQLIVAGKLTPQKRRRGRPRKVPRPEDQLPRIPLPEHLAHLQTA